MRVSLPVLKWCQNPRFEIYFAPKHRIQEFKKLIPLSFVIVSIDFSVMFWYCDGGSFTGDRVEPAVSSNGKQVWFRGRRNLDAMLHYLRDQHNLGDATEVLLSGGSAGGLSAYIHADYIRAGFGPQVKFRAAPVSGFFLDHDTVRGTADYPTKMRGVYEMMNSSHGVNQRCLEAMAPDDWRCMFAQYSCAHTDTPVFPLNSAVDAYQMGAILQVPGTCAGLNASTAKDFSNCNTSELASIIRYEGDFVRAIQSSVAYSKAGNGGFVESCMEHCAAQGASWNTISQHNVTMQQAVSAWWDADDGAPASDHWHLPCTLHAAPPGECNPTCAAK